MNHWNRFNGFRRIPVFLAKPLKRLTTFPSRPNPKLKLGENEKLIFLLTLFFLIVDKDYIANNSAHEDYSTNQYH
jgi:hypothetical protein